MLFIAISYLKFLLKSTNQHGVHSPFVYNLVTKCFYKKKDSNAWSLFKKIEQQLLEQYPHLQADVLIVPHHGSKTSSSKKFIAHVNPKIAVVSAGFLNRWKMPVIEVVNRYQKQNIKLFNSAETGQIMLNFSKHGIEQYTYRENLWPFWFANSF